MVRGVAMGEQRDSCKYFRGADGNELNRTTLETTERLVEMPIYGLPRAL